MGSLIKAISENMTYPRGLPSKPMQKNWAFKFRGLERQFWGVSDFKCCFYRRWTPHPVIVTIRDNKDYIGLLLYYYYTTIILLTSTTHFTYLCDLLRLVWGVSPELGVPFYKDCSILGSILGSPYFGKLPY